MSLLFGRFENAAIRGFLSAVRLHYTEAKGYGFESPILSARLLCIWMITKQFFVT